MYLRTGAAIALVLGLVGAFCYVEGVGTPESAQAAQGGQPSDLLFQAGFEPDTQIVGKQIVGADRTLTEKNDWLVDGHAFAKSIDFNLGGATAAGETSAEIAPDPVNPSNHALRLTLRNSAQEGSELKARAQLELYRIQPGLREFTFSTDVYLGEGFAQIEKYPGKIDWLTIAEFWNNEFWSLGGKYGFRITVGVGKDRGDHPLNFFLTSDTTDRTMIWQRDDKTALVPIGKWFRLTYYFLEGDETHGRFVLSLTPRGGKTKILYDVTNYTYSPFDPAPDGLTGFNPFKAYTSKELMQYVHESNDPLQIYWDNAKFYKGRHPD
jgi:hypothetical protein